MQGHGYVSLFLDNDNTGSRCVLEALALDIKQFSDERKLYERYQDLNEWVIHSAHTKK
jgi:hypothetical protein